MYWKDPQYWKDLWTDLKAEFTWENFRREYPAILADTPRRWAIFLGIGAITVLFVNGLDVIARWWWGM